MNKLIQMVNNVAIGGSVSVDVQQDGIIDEVLMDQYFVPTTTAGYIHAELSFSSYTPTSVTHDSRSTVCCMTMGANSAAGATSVTRTVSARPGCEVFAGERLYLHTFGSNMSAQEATFVISLRPKTGGGRDKSGRFTRR